MSFHRDLKIGHAAEEIVISHYHQKPNVASVDPVEETEDMSIMEMQRLYGDIEIQYQEGDIEFVEVKSDNSMSTTGNLFLEILSDDGSRTGNKTLGWFHRPCNIHTYVFYNRVNPSESVSVPLKVLKDYVDTREHELRTVGLMCNPGQPNRSQGILVKHSEVVRDLEDAIYVDLSNE